MKYKIFKYDGIGNVSIWKFGVIVGENIVSSTKLRFNLEDIIQDMRYSNDLDVVEKDKVLVLESLMGNELILEFDNIETVHLDYPEFFL